MDKYIPIACSFYDELEFLAVRKIKSKILYLKDEKEILVEDYIVDFKTINKEEFMVLAQGEKIRLDKLIKINDKEVRLNSCS